MPTFAEVLAARRAGTNSLLGSIKQQPGFLTTLGRILDTPRRETTEFLTGIKDPGGRDVLEKFGLLGPNNRGLDFGDVAGFGFEVLTDPLSYLGGLGTLNRAGRLGSKFSRLSAQVPTLRSRLSALQRVGAIDEAARTGRNLNQTLARLRGLSRQGARPLPADTIGAGLRDVLRLDVPFGPEIPLIRGAPLLRGGARGGRFVANLPGIAGVTRGIRRAFDTNILNPRPLGEFAPPRNQLIRKSDNVAFDLARSDIANAPFDAQNQMRRLIPRFETARLAGDLPAAELQRNRVAFRNLRESPELMSDARKTLADIAEARRNLAPPDLEKLRLAVDLNDNLDELLKVEVAFGARHPQNIFRGTTKLYAERVLTPEARRWMDTQNMWGKFSESVGDRVFSTKTGSQIRRVDNLVEEFTTAANEFFKKHKPDFDADWFELNPVKSVAQRFVDHKVSTANALLWETLVDSAAAKGPGMPIEEFLARGPLHSLYGDPILHKMGPLKGPAAVRRFLETTKNPRIAALAGKSVPLDVAAEALQINAKLSAPEEVGALLRAFDTASSGLRFAITQPFPAFHIRNLFSDTLLSWIGGGANPKFVRQAFRLTNPFSRDVAGRGRWLEFMERLGVFRGEAARTVRNEFLGRPGTAGRLGDVITKKLPGLAKTGKKLKTKELTTWVENFTRTWHFLSMKGKGFTDLEAASSVRRWLLDYSKLTDFEKQVMRRGAFFYNWPRQVLPTLFESFFTRTGRMAGLTRASTLPTADRGDQPLPDFLRRSGALPSPFGPGPSGERRFVFGFGSPIEEFNKLDISSDEGGALGLARGATRQAGQMLNPILRVPAEFTLGKSTFFDQELLSLDKAEPILNTPGLRQLFDVKEQTLPTGDKRLRGDPLRLFLLNSSPLGRVARTANDAANVVTGGSFEPRRGAIESALRGLTGVKTSGVGKQEAARAALETLRRRGIELQRKGLLGESNIAFALRGPEGEKDPSALDNLKKRRAIAKLKRLLREQQ